VNAPELTAHGIAVRLPAGCEGRIYRRPEPLAAFKPANRGARSPAATATAPTAPTAIGAPVGRTHPGAAGWLGERPGAVVHLATFALPVVRGDYGSGAVESMTARDVFLAMLEFGPECLGTALYRTGSRPRLQPEHFDPNGLQRRIAGQSGAQFFFTERNRPFCLYVVLGSHRRAEEATEQANVLLNAISVLAL